MDRAAKAALAEYAKAARKRRAEVDACEAVVSAAVGTALPAKPENKLELAPQSQAALRAALGFSYDFKKKRAEEQSKPQSRNPSSSRRTKSGSGAMAKPAATVA